MLLLDSHVVLWQVDGNPRLGDGTRRRMEAATAVHVSAASIWELAVKCTIGKLVLPERFAAELADQGLVLLPVTAEQAEGIRDLPEGLRRHDPFDRLLVAQARVLGLTFVTADRSLLALGLPFVVDASL